jgi:hypothetical protein
MSGKRYNTGGSGARAGFPRTTLDSLDDTFSYTGHAREILTVKPDESGIEPKILSWKEPVISLYDNTSGLPPAAIGDRYIALVTAHGWTAGHIYEAI